MTQTISDLVQYNEAVNKYNTNRTHYKNLLEKSSDLDSPFTNAYSIEQLPKKAGYFTDKLHRLNQTIEGKVQEQYGLDHLTQLQNRRSTDKYMQKNGKGKIVGMLDIDHFKKINDTYGHPFGDEIIKSIAKTLEEHSRDNELVARYGGEEFLTVFNTSDLYVANKAMERFRQDIESLEFYTDKSKEPVKVTISGGIAKNEPDEPLAITIDRADKALYGAKDSGRNKIIIADYFLE